MKKNIFAVYLLFSNILLAQVCPNTDYPNYYNCSDVQQFVNDYPNCTKLPSSLRLPYDGGDLTNFPALSQLDSISGSLVCSECDISSFAGLTNLVYVGGDVHIDEPSSNIENLQGLNNLTYINGTLRFSECFTLTSTFGLGTLTYLGGFSVSECNNLIELIGFENIELIPGSFSVSESNDLLNLSGFESLNFIEGDLNISENGSLINLEGLNTLKTLGGDLELEDNSNLLDLDVLTNLSHVNGEVDISGNQLLHSIEGLTSLVSINGPIKIKNNESLMNLSGLDNIDPISITDLKILNGSILSNCSVNSICQYLTNSMGPNDINSNAEGCNSDLQITESCIDLNVIENNSSKNQDSKLLKMIDLLGREYKEHHSGMLLFYIYDNGNVEKMFIH